MGDSVSSRRGRRSHREGGLFCRRPALWPMDRPISGQLGYEIAEQSLTRNPLQNQNFIQSGTLKRTMAT